MPIEDLDPNEGIAPTKPHLAVVLDNSGRILAIPVGAKMFIIEDPKDPLGLYPVFLVSVDHKHMTLRCNCGQPKCTRVAKFKAKWSGIHPRQFEEK